MKTPDPFLTRRQFTRRAAAALAAPAFLRGQHLNSRLRLAVIGTGGRGGGNLKGVGSEDIVALCDVSARSLAAAAAAHPRARQERDFRRLFDREREFDAVVVSTAEHTHALATLLALKAKKHVYCEKPLTHNVHEARLVRTAARAAGVVTQMGIQIHASENFRRVVELIRGGVIGPVTEVHVWVSRAWGLQGAEAAKANQDRVHVTGRPPAMPVPPDLDWDLWLGPAPEHHSCRTRGAVVQPSSTAGGLLQCAAAITTPVLCYLSRTRRVSPLRPHQLHLSRLHRTRHKIEA